MKSIISKIEVFLGRYFLGQKLTLLIPLVEAPLPSVVTAFTKTGLA